MIYYLGYEVTKLFVNYQHLHARMGHVRKFSLKNFVV